MPTSSSRTAVVAAKTNGAAAHVVKFKQRHKDDIEYSTLDANLDSLVKEELIEADRPLSLNELWEKLETVADSKIKLAQSLHRLAGQGDIEKVATDGKHCLYGIAELHDT